MCSPCGWAGGWFEAAGLDALSPGLTQNRLVSLLLGVDGGGSGCRARLTDLAGNVLGEGTGGPANARLGVAVAHGSILAATQQALTVAGLAPEACGQISAGLGLAGAGQPEARALLLAADWPFARVRIETDALAAWAGAFAGADGAVLILGTGSAGLCVADGRQTYIGGRGWELSDQGSGAWIGRRALSLALLAHDGMAPMTGLARSLMLRFSNEVDRAIAWAERAGPAAYAALVPSVLAAGDAGDPMAKALLRDASSWAARLAGRLLAAGAPTIVAMGGLAPVLTALFPATLSGRLASPMGDARAGALALAAGRIPEFA